MKNFKYYIIITLLKALSFLPLKALYVLSNFMCVVVYRLFHYRIKVVRSNLKNAFPEKTPAELKKIEHGFYRHLCDCIVETIKLLHISDRELQSRVQVCNVELITSKSDKPIILFMGHYGNWEWVPVVTMVVPEPKIMGALYRPVKDEVMNRVMLRIRSRFDSECIPMRRAYKRIIELKKTVNTFLIGFIADQRPTGPVQNNHTVFLNQRATYLAGGETIGARIDANFAYLDIERVKRGNYVLTFRELEITEDDTEENPRTRAFLRQLEENIRRAPEYWLWSHNRWKQN